MGKPQFSSVHEMDNDKEFYQYALGIARELPSEETLRQRMDDIGSSLRNYIIHENVSMLKSNGILLEAGCYFIIKRNLRREGKENWFEMAQSNSKNITNPDMTDEEVITQYHAHGECEQFHSEIKTDMDVERLP